MLHESEWLHLAKRVPVGGTKREYHGAERRPNMVVRNLQDKYTCYCHSCHEGGVVKKDHVLLSDAPVVETKPTNYELGFLRRIQVHLPDPNVPYGKIVKFLHDKGMALEYLKHLNTMWSADSKRIVLSTPDQVIGRDITGFSKSKWYKYSGLKSYVRAADLPVTGKVVLTEDFFSACKGQYFAGSDALFVALTGTVIYDDLLAQLLNADCVYLLLDGDKAGAEGIVKALRRLHLLGIPVVTLEVPAGKDPKDMSHVWWEALCSKL